MKKLRTFFCSAMLAAIAVAVILVIFRGWRQGGLALLQLRGLC